MYSRYHDRAQPPIQIPENSSGSAFSDRSHVTEEPPPPRRIDVAKPTPLSEKPSPSGMAPLPRPILLPPAPPEHKEERKEQTASHEENSKHSAAPAPFQGLFSGRDTLPSKLLGIGFDELLLLGLIILLSLDGQSSDLILWLVLLLFCG